MAKIFTGKVVSNKMTDTAVVEVFRLVPHPLYKKLLKRSKKFKIATMGKKLEIGETVKIVETKPISKDKHFALYVTEKQIKPVKMQEKEVANNITVKSKKEKKA